MKTTRIILAAIAAMLFIASCAEQGGWSEREKIIIERSGSVMYVAVMPQDSAVLRTPCADFTDEQLSSELFNTLKDKMMSTVTDPSQDGVGIAAPQVGISRRLIVVQRLDKEGEPFEAYANIRIDSLLGPTVLGPEGCLSIPPYRGIVPRAEGVVISYTDPATKEMVVEEISGYTAIIFQHECDHLDGILYTDRADTVFVNDAWALERSSHSYSRPTWW